ncbi:unnamed protein product [Anisakis simplex]|uniref:UPF0585 protein C16orf13 (inferred by orthology to a human protein) n=1 Tax=Anisakis simplex TaxID=6269 RepID=A0A0M3KE92_ANISI|nr:unnamed protein product [Anisakis simplex]
MSSSKQQLTQPTHPCPFDGSAKKSEEAADRNKHHILEILQKYMDQSPLKVLEISSGTGRHVEHFARHFPHAVFQPTEIDADSVNSLNATLANNQLSNIKQPLILDASKPFDTWCLPEDFCCGCVDVIININMIHVSSNAAVDGLFEASGKLLKSKSGLLITYGAYSVDGQITPESNVVFDRKIRSINPEWGLRDVSEMEEVLNSFH